jgi:hypothetical protein
MEDIRNMYAENQSKMEVSGKALQSIPKFVVKKFGKDGYKRWLDAISAEAHNIFILPIKQGNWFPLKETLIEPSANIAQLFYDWDLKAAAWELGRFSADCGMSNVRKLIVKAGSAQFFLTRACEYLVSYYKPVNTVLSEINDSSAVYRITEFPEMDKMIEYRIGGWLERALEINGCKSVRVEIPKSLAGFHPYTEFNITWE